MIEQNIIDFLKTLLDGVADDNGNIDPERLLETIEDLLGEHYGKGGEE